jgi:glycosyltransferase involved in cell wall biosynthesis
MNLCIGAHPMIPCHFNPYKVPPKPRPDRASALVALGLTSRKRHVLNVGLFTPGKNQGEVFEIARRMPDVQFHFVGNQAVNFAEYWQPLMANKSANCNVWGERDDVDRFYAAMDLLLFVSKAELAPLVPVEALAWGMPVLMRRLPIYQGAYDGKVTYLLENGFYNTGMQVRQALDMGAK